MHFFWLDCLAVAQKQIIYITKQGDHDASYIYWTL